MPEADETYELFRRASDLLDAGHPAAAAMLFERLAASEPDSRSIAEGLARALFDAGRFAESADAFERLVALAPADDYAHYGAGMSLWRVQRFIRAEEHLAMARVMRPERSEYAAALKQVRATMRARAEASLPMEGSIEAAMRGESRASLSDGSRPPVDVHDVALLDLDGVVYVGAQAVPHAAESLSALRDRGMRLAFVTNNASRPAAEVAAHLTEIGVPADSDEVVTSAQAGARLMAELIPAGSTVLAIGGPGVAIALEARGFAVTREDSDQVSAVMQGFGPEMSWSDLAEGAYALARGVPWVATNLDSTFPSPRGLAPGNGSIIAALAHATGRRPTVVAGKPEPALMEESIARTRASRAVVVGDRLDTDIEAANRAGLPSLMVMTGVDGIAALAAAPQHLRPTMIGLDLRALLHEHPPVIPEDGGWRCDYARASAVDGVLSIEGDLGTADGALSAARALLVAVWHGGEADATEAIALVQQAIATHLTRLIPRSAE